MTTPPSDKVGELDDKLKEILLLIGPDEFKDKDILEFYMDSIKQAFEPTLHQKQVELLEELRNIIYDTSRAENMDMDNMTVRLTTLDRYLADKTAHLRKQT